MASKSFLSLLLIVVLVLSLAPVPVQSENPRFRAREDGFVEVDALGFVVDGQDLLADARSLSPSSPYINNFFTAGFTNSFVVDSTEWTTKLFVGPQDGTFEWSVIGNFVLAQLTVTMTTSAANKVFNLRLPNSVLAAAGIPIASAGSGFVTGGSPSTQFRTNITVDATEIAIDSAHCCTQNAREWLFGFTYPTTSVTWGPVASSPQSISVSGNVGIGDFSGTPPVDSLHIQSGGIRFGSSATSLSFYAEGALSPSLNTTAVNFSSLSMDKQTTYWVRTGNMVFCNILIGWNSASGGTGNIIIQNALPFPVRRGASIQNVYFNGYLNNVAIPTVTGASNLLFYALRNTKDIHVAVSTNVDGVVKLPVSAATDGGVKRIHVSGTYMTDPTD